ncbi:hypothetical protein EV702DRAFT_1096641 [Suillus placidus]|uniref:Uncharacterized protein n=1 Tax=Suillus placidus TaxID=48579 RepID=A0A9P6ZYE7_9AGAM|nr:hypothetical protein EV702DRAFT_1096641 [Suillus placidus]
MKYVSRKFVDLIQGATSKWTNWDPTRRITVGDFGIIINETGEFSWEGNIYDPHFQKQFKSSNYKFDFDLADPALRPKEQEGDDLYIVKSWGVTAKAINESPEAGVQSAMNVLEVDLQFVGYNRAAVLVMYKPRYSSLPNDEHIVRLLESMPDVLKGKYIVTEVISCAAYIMHLSDKKAEKFSVTLKATEPVLPAVAAGRTVDFTWSSEAKSGFTRHGSDPTYNYMPLYRLKKFRSKFWEWPFEQR